MKNYILFSSIILLSACSSFKLSDDSWSPEKNAVTQRAHAQVLEELGQDRGPASALNELNVSFDDLARLRPGKFEVYVFPKVSSQTRMEPGEEEEYLGPPMVFEVSILAVSRCQRFIRQGLFAKYNPSEAFPAELGEDERRRCAILEVRDRKLAGIDKALLRKDDQLSLRLFIDDSYLIHATDHELFETRNQRRVVRRLGDGRQMGPDLSYFPVELPARGDSGEKAALGKSFAKRLDGVAIHQIRKRYSKGFSAPQCEGMVFASKDPLGGQSKVGWCRGIPWPSFGENRRFFSVTQPLRVR